jgi:hypothetical protein
MPRSSGQFMAIAVSCAIVGVIFSADRKIPSPLGNPLNATAVMAASQINDGDAATKAQIIGVSSLAFETSISQTYPLLPIPALTTPTLPIECEERFVVAPPPTPEPPMIAPVVAVSVPPPQDAPIALAWRLNLEIGGPRTTLDLQRGNEAQMRIQCDAADLSMPAGGITARGHVVISGSFLDARCERMTIAWPSGDVSLIGGVEVGFRHGGAMRLLRAESLTFRFDGAAKTAD